MNTDEERRNRNRRAKRDPVQSAIANRNSTMPCAGSPAHRVPSPEAVEIGPRPLTSLSALRRLQSSICNLGMKAGFLLVLVAVAGDAGMQSCVGTRSEKGGGRVVDATEHLAHEVVA